jgi:hypothetical protein
MIYWHVERKRVCVYSQLKTCSSSEVAAMMEGLIRHSDNVPSSGIEANYTDTHGVGRRIRVHPPARLPAAAPAEEHRPVPVVPG